MQAALIIGRFTTIAGIYYTMRSQQAQQSPLGLESELVNVGRQLAPPSPYDTRDWLNWTRSAPAALHSAYRLLVRTMEIQTPGLISAGDGWRQQAELRVTPEQLHTEQAVLKLMLQDAEVHTTTGRTSLLASGRELFFGLILTDNDLLSSWRRFAWSSIQGLQWRTQQDEVAARLASAMAWRALLADTQHLAGPRTDIYFHGLDLDKGEVQRAAHKRAGPDFTDVGDKRARVRTLESAPNSGEGTPADSPAVGESEPLMDSASPAARDFLAGLLRAPGKHQGASQREDPFYERLAGDSDALADLRRREAQRRKDLATLLSHYLDPMSETRETDLERMTELTTVEREEIYQHMSEERQKGSKSTSPIGVLIRVRQEHDRPPAFSGSPFNPDEVERLPTQTWLDMFEMFAKGRRWSKDQVNTALITSLRGTALAWYQGLSRQYKLPMAWFRLRRLLLERYPDENEYLSETSFESLKQRPGENLESSFRGATGSSATARSRNPRANWSVTYYEVWPSQSKSTWVGRARTQSRSQRQK